MDQPALKKYRRRFPFKVSTTSYIYPDEIVPNVLRLAPSLDEIELVLFESETRDSLPDLVQIASLMRLSRLHQVGFNVHLPIDIFLGDRCEEVRAHGISIVKKVIQRTLCLNPSLYTLHLEFPNPPNPPLLKGDEGGFVRDPDVEGWRMRLIRSMEEILNDGIESKRISIETLGYPFDWIEDIVSGLGFSICLDIGHILTHGYNVQHYLEKYLPGTSIIHLHGVQNGIDHLGIGKLSEEVFRNILSCLHHYHGIVSIEVFSFDELKSSLDILEERWIKG